MFTGSGGFYYDMLDLVVIQTGDSLSKRVDARDGKRCALFLYYLNIFLPFYFVSPSISNEAGVYGALLYFYRSRLCNAFQSCRREASGSKANVSPVATSLNPLSTHETSVRPLSDTHPPYRPPTSRLTTYFHLRFCDMPRLSYDMLLWIYNSTM